MTRQSRADGGAYAGDQARFARERRIEISATVPEAVAKAFENAKDLQKEAPCVTTNGIAGAGFEPATFGL